jgi:hypothetical protein
MEAMVESRVLTLHTMALLITAFIVPLILGLAAKLELVLEMLNFPEEMVGMVEET